jgi:hypothetical protein
MDEPLIGEMSGGDHGRRVIALAGVLAECAVTRFELEVEGDDCLVEFEARATDLPGLLADPTRSVGLHARARTLISVTPKSIGWVTHDAQIDAALRRAKTSLEP